MYLVVGHHSRLQSGGCGVDFVSIADLRPGHSHARWAEAELPSHRRESMPSMRSLQIT